MSEWKTTALIAACLLSSAAAAAAEAPLFRRADAPVEARVNDLLSRLTLEEKIGLLHGSFSSGGVPRLGVGTLEMLDGRQGLRPMDKTTHATLLPSTLALSCTWDIEAARRFGRLLAEEMLALDKHVLLAPMMNLVRTPLGGRNFENLGEDPLLAGAMATAYVGGVQELGVAACSCLLVANDYEARRHFTSSNMDDRTLRECHLLPYELTVRDGNVWTMMSSNSLFNGIHCAHNRRLLQEIVKDEIGFDGVMITDWRAAYDAVPAALAGTDMTTGICGYVFGDGRLLQAVKSGQVPRELIDDKVGRVLRLYCRVGLLDPDSRPEGGLDTAAHRAEAVKLAAEGMVLLKNDRNLLPLDLDRWKTVLITGPGAAVVPQGGGSGNVPAAVEITPLAGIQEALGDEVHVRHVAWSPPRESPPALGKKKKKPAQAQAARITNANSPAEPATAQLCQAAREADLVIFVAYGHPYSEGRDLADMDLPGHQAAAIASMVEANPNLVVVLPVGGGAVTLDPWGNKVPAILGSWYAGQASGAAIAQVLLGQHNPGGKLSFTFGRRLDDYACHALGQWPAKLILAQDPGDPGVRPEERKAIHAFTGEYREGVFVGHRWFDQQQIEPWFPFGYGLSYTSFQLSEPELAYSASGARVSCTVTNTGSRYGSEVVQAYVAPREPALARPPRELKGFTKVWLKPGECRRVEIELRPGAFAYYDAERRCWKAAAGHYEVALGTSSRDLPFRLPLELKKDVVVEHY